MGFKEGQLYLDSPNGTYYSGQAIQGKLTFQLEKPKSCRGLYVKFKGYCHVHWTTTHSRTVNGRTETYTVNHDSHEDYIKAKVYMLGGETGEYIIQPGKHEYPFHFQLPDNCPSSFEGTYGRVRYEITAVIDKFIKINEQKKVLARVMAPMDLNVDPYCKEPIHIEIQKRFYWCCCKRGLSEVSLTLPLGGYCPGQIIPIKVNCTNNGKAELKEIRLIIAKKLTFIATSAPGKQIVKKKVAEIKTAPIPAGTTKSWTVDMVVPAQDVYNLLTCQYIHVEYKFKAELAPNGLRTNTSESRRIVIGTIPLMGVQGSHPPVCNTFPESNPPGVNPAFVGGPGDEILPYPENPPPYPGNLNDPQNMMTYEIKANQHSDIVKTRPIGFTELSQDTPGPANAYNTLNVTVLESSENALPEKKE